ncbi:MAG: hypothetical protein ABIK84_03040 [candidate division WOR-3 bacterium]
MGKLPPKELKKKKGIFKAKNLFLLSFILILFFLLLNFDGRYFLGGDNIRYLILAEALISGQGYRDIYEPASPPHTTYPPGFPLLLVPFLFLFNHHYPLLNTLPLILALLSVFLFFHLLKIEGREKPPFFILASLLLVSLSPIFLEYSHTLLSEMPFLFFTLLAFYLFRRFELKPSFLFLLFSFFSLIFSVFLRTAGIGILPAFFFYLLSKRRYKEILILIGIFLIFFTPYLLRNLHLGKGSGYLELFTYKNPYAPEEGRIGLSEYLTRFGKNFYLYNFYIFPQMLFPYSLPPFFFFLLGLLSLILIIITLRQKLKEKESLYPFYLFFSLFILYSWPEVWTGDRFLFPLFPFLIYYLLWGLEKIFRKGLSLFYLVFGIILLGYMIKGLSQGKENLAINISQLKGDRYAGYPLDWVRYFQACEWIKGNTEKDAVIVARKPEFIYFLTKRKSFLYQFTNDPNKLLKNLEERGATHVLFDQFFWTNTTIRYLTPVINAFPNRFEVLYATPYPQMIIYRLKKEE